MNGLKRPGCPGWNLRGRGRSGPDRGYPIEVWIHVTGLVVVSCLEPRGRSGGESQYHLVISKKGDVCDDLEALRAVADFDLLWAAEADRVDDGTRHFWQAVPVEAEGRSAA
jgi:hypothetical protein